MTSPATNRWQRYRARKRNGNAARVRRFRQRQRDGVVVLPPIPFDDEVGLEVLLKRHGLLPSCGAKDHDELADAVGQLLKRLIAKSNALQHGY